MSEPPTVQCYDAAYAPQTGHYHMLLADVSDTHGQPEWSLPPTQRQCEHVMECIAKFHAFWWEHPRLGQDIGALPTTEQIEKGIADTESKARAFIGFLGDRLSEDRLRIYDHVLAAMPRLSCHLRWARLCEHRAITITHGDSHWWNFLYPHDAARDKVYLIDWQAWRIAVGTDDVAYMLAFWHQERRRRLEQTLLRLYHQVLLREGVTNYAWHECWLDYRYSVIRNLFVPVWLWAHKVPATTWWPLVEPTMLAFEDLGCDEMLEA